MRPTVHRAAPRRTPNMTHRAGLAAPALLAVAAVLAGCAPDRVAAPVPAAPPARGPAADIANLTTAPVLYAQSSSLTEGLGPASVIGDVYLADDFSVPASWTVSQLSFSGRLYDPTLTFAIRADQDGAPGAVIATYTLWPTKTDPNPASLPGYAMTDYLFTLPSPLTLTRGKYWLTLLAWLHDEDPGEGTYFGGTLFWQGTATQGSGALRSDDGGATWYGTMPYTPGVTDFSFALFGELPKTQTITFPAITPDPAAPTTSATLGATATSGLAVSYTSLTADVCTVSGTTVSYAATGTCTIAADQAGNSAYQAAARVTRDVAVSRAAQTITFTSTPPNPALLGRTYTLRATGGASGNPVTFSSLTTGVCTVSGSTVTFAHVGTCTVAADQAGTATYAAAPRRTQTVAVVYAWTGFFAPVNNPPTVNVANAGSAVPVRFALGGDQGLAVLAAGSPSSQAVACQSGAATDPVEQTVTAGNSSLGYDAASGQYTYTWKTDRAWAGACRTLTVTLTDGTAHTASFQFR